MYEFADKLWMVVNQTEPFTVIYEVGTTAKEVWGKMEGLKIIGWSKKELQKKGYKAVRVYISCNRLDVGLYCKEEK